MHAKVKPQLTTSCTNLTSRDMSVPNPDVRKTIDWDQMSSGCNCNGQKLHKGAEHASTCMQQISRSGQTQPVNDEIKNQDQRWI